MPPNAREIYHKIVDPYQTLIAVIIGIAIAEIAFITFTPAGKFPLLEIPLSLTLTIITTWLTSQLF